MNRSLIIIFLSIFICINVNAQSYCDFISEIQKYQDNVKIDDSSSLMRIDKSTFDIDTYMKLFNKLTLDSKLKCEVVYVDYTLGGNPALILLDDSLSTKEKIDKRVQKNAKTLDPIIEEINAIGELIKDSSKRICNNLMPERSELGFIQYLFFHEMGEQFALYWHSLYDEKYVVCNNLDLERIIKIYKKSKMFDCDIKSIKQLNTKDITPTIEKSTDQYIITWYEIETHNGIYKRIYEIQENYPFAINLLQNEKIIEINPKFMY